MDNNLSIDSQSKFLKNSTKIQSGVKHDYENIASVVCSHLKGASYYIAQKNILYLS